MFLSFLSYRSIGVLLFSASLAQGAVLVEDATGPVVDDSPRMTLQRRATNGFDFRKTNRAAVGMSVGGVSGVAGVHIELNFNPENSLNIGFGGGGGYSTFAAQWKRVISGKSLLPYVNVGYARWFSQSEGALDPDSFQPSFIKEKLVSADADLRNGFVVDMITPTLGVQYLQLDGDWQGLSLGLEVNLLFSLQKLTSVPAGSFVMLYYF